MLKLLNTKLKHLQQLLPRAIRAFKQVNHLKGIDFSDKLRALVERYNNRKEGNTLRSRSWKTLPRR